MFVWCFPGWDDNSTWILALCQMAGSNPQQALSVICYLWSSEKTKLLVKLLSDVKDGIFSILFSVILTPMSNKILRITNVWFVRPTWAQFSFNLLWKHQPYCQYIEVTHAQQWSEQYVCPSNHKTWYVCGNREWLRPHIIIKVTWGNFESLSHNEIKLTFLLGMLIS